MSHLQLTSHKVSTASFCESAAETDKSPFASGEPRGTQQGAREWILLALVLSLALLLRFLFLGEKSFWLDEIWSFTVGRMSWHFLWWSAAHQDPNMTLYDALLHVWMYVGSSEFAVRGLSALAGAATVPVLYAVGKRLFDSWVGIVASLLLSLNLFHIQYSQEARSYSLLAFFVTLSSLFFIDCLERRQTRYWVLYSLSVVCGTYAHVFACLVFASHLASLAFLPSRDVPWKRVTLATATIGVLSTPLVILMYIRALSPFIALSWVPRPTVRRVYDLFYALSGNANYYGIEVGKAPGGKIVLVACFAMCLVTFVLALQLWRSTGKSLEFWRLGFLLGWLFVPIIIVLAVSSFMPMFLNRYFIICAPPLSLLAAKGMRSMKSRSAGVLVLSIILLSEAMGLPQYYRYRINNDEWKTVTDYVLARARPGDGIMFCVAHGRLLFDYYRERSDNRSVAIDEIYPDLKGETDDPKALSYFPPLGDNWMKSVVTHPRIWFVMYPEDSAPNSDVSRSINAGLARSYSSVHQTKIDTTILRLYGK
jgi:mannosyltransferase